MSKTAKTILVALAILVAAGVAVAVYYRNTIKGALPAVSKPGGDITELLPGAGEAPAVNNTSLPLKLPDGFAISIFAKDLPGARDLVLDSFGNMWVSQTGQGTISQLELSSGKVARQNIVFKNLDRPHGLAIDGNMLYFAEETKITRVTLYSDDPGQKIADLPQGGRHYTRSLVFGYDGRLYVSIGSTCDVCNEKDERIATIYSMNKDGSDMKQVASGLRNAVFMAMSPVDGRIWATEMGRDNLGDNLPPDEINIIESGKDYGWPVCYGQNIHDTNFDKNVYIQNPCNGKIPAHIELPAHSAPLGLDFVPEEPVWPEEMWSDLLVAFHGSWNRTQPTGYKIARVKLDDKGNFQGMEDFISGWLAADGKTALGRPVDVLTTANGILYISDDKAGVVYKVERVGSEATGNEDVIVNNISSGQTIASPLTITGKARGTWYFEASFPVKIADDQNNIVATGIAQAQGDWMTTDYVPFSVTLTFVKPTSATGKIIFQKDNPSGLPEYDKQYVLPVKF